MTTQDRRAWEHEELAARLSRCEHSGRLDGLEIEYYVSGGLPPPHYRSDQFRCLTVDGRELIELARPKFDRGYTINYPVEKFQLPAEPENVRTVARLLREGRVFDATYPEERRPDIADILSTEVLATEGGRQTKKVYYQKPPEPVMPLDEFVAGARKLLVTRGERGLYHLGKRID